MRLSIILLALVLLAGCSGNSAARRGTAAAAAVTPARLGAGQAAPFDPASFSLNIEKVADGFKNPTDIVAAGDGSGRLFVVEKGGTIRILVNGSVQPEPFLDITSKVLSSSSEQGLLGLAFHPQYANNHRFFVGYTASNGDDSIAEYRLSSDPNRADPASGRVLLAILDPAPNHNGGNLMFGPDGYLYAGFGDGGGGNDQFKNGQNLDALLGKLLRLDVNNGDPYGIPAGNPFAGRQGVRPEIWAYGLRNPWRYSFDSATGDLYIADVGQDRYEEVDVQPASSQGGENYGWNIMEGLHCLRGDSCDQSGLVLPVAEYDHTQGCSITGGFIYRGRQFPMLNGAYLYGDYCCGRIWSLDQQADGSWRQTELLHTKLGISSFGQDEAGELYVADINGGGIYHLTAAPH
jgi:glucose/arabinose dehydrogenase